MGQENEMRKIINKLETETSTDVLSEAFIAEVTNPDLQYELVGSITITEDLTEEDIEAWSNSISEAIWKGFDD